MRSSGFVSRFLFVLVAVALSISILISSVSAEAVEMSVHYYSFEWLRVNSDFTESYAGSISDADLSVINQTFYGRQFAFPTNNVGTIPVGGYCKDIFLGVNFGSEDLIYAVFQPNYSYHVTYTITGRYASESAASPFVWADVELSSKIQTYAFQALTDSSNSIDISDYSYLGSLTGVRSYTDSSFAPATYCVDYTFEVVFHLPFNFNCDYEYPHFVTDFHFPVSFTGNPQNSSYIFISFDGISGVYDPEGEEINDAVDQIIANQTQLGIIAHQDAEAIKQQIQSSFGSLDSSIQQGFGDLGELIQGDGSFDAGQDGIESGVDGYLSVESDLLGAVGYDTLDIDRMDFDSLLVDADVPTTVSADWWIKTLNPIYVCFPFFVVFPLLLGLLATLLGRRYD